MQTKICIILRIIIIVLVEWNNLLINKIVEKSKKNIMHTLKNALLI